MQPEGRIHNFGAGPAVLPHEVVEEVSSALPNLSDSGFGLMEVSHRSDTFQAIIDSAVGRVRSLLSVPDEYEVLLLQGGASTQFFMVPMNFLTAETTADYLVTGSWSQKAVVEAKRFGNVNIACSGEDRKFCEISETRTYSTAPALSLIHI